MVFLVDPYYYVMLYLMIDISNIFNIKWNIQLTFQFTLINSSANTGPPYETQTCTSCPIDE